MKHLKTYESNNYEKLKIGDKVICLFNSRSNLIQYNIYEIEKIRNEKSFIQFEVSGIEGFWDSDRFRKATPEEIIQNNINKYNL